MKFVHTKKSNIYKLGDYVEVTSQWLNLPFWGGGANTSYKSIIEKEAKGEVDENVSMVALEALFSWIDSKSPSNKMFCAAVSVPILKESKRISAPASDGAWYLKLIEVVIRWEL